MKKSYLADLVLLSISFTWGATFVLIKEAINTIPPFIFVSVRFLIAGVILTAFILTFYRHILSQLSKRIWLPGIWLGFWLFAGYAFQTFGLQYTTASKAGFITGLSVVMVPLFSFWILHHLLKRNALIGILIATLGLAMISLNRETSINFGDILVFGCAISFAIQITSVGRYAPNFSALLLGLIQIFTCGLLSLFCAFLFERNNFISLKLWLNKEVVVALIICSLIATAFAYVAQNQFQKFTTPTRTALIFTTEPVFAALFGYLWAGERFSIVQGIGCLFILSGMLISETEYFS